MSKSRVNPVTVINGRLICTSTSGFITPDGAAATINRLTAEVERLGVYEPKIDLRSSPTDMRVHVAKEAMRNLVVAFSEFNRCGNYTETQVEYEGESFLVTVQNLNRPTPHDLRVKAEQVLAAVSTERCKYKHPCQPVVIDGYGIKRFVKNRIIDAMLDLGMRGEVFDLNTLSEMSFDKNDWRQLAQLIGYSVDGFFTLSYVSNTLDIPEYEDEYEEYIGQIIDRTKEETSGK